MTDLKQAAQQALDALDQLTDDVDGTGLNTKPSFDAALLAITALKAALGQQAEPTPWRDMIVASLVREGINKHRARELADHFAAQQQAEPICPECKAAVLYECVACSSNNYPPQQQAEPVAWIAEVELSVFARTSKEKTTVEIWKKPVLDSDVAVYTTPPQRPWVGLTDEDFLEACQIAERGNYLVALQRIQIKLKEKNDH